MITVDGAVPTRVEYIKHDGGGITASVRGLGRRVEPNERVVLEWQAPRRVGRWRAMFGLESGPDLTERVTMVVRSVDLYSGVVDLVDLASVVSHNRLTANGYTYAQALEMLR